MKPNDATNNRPIAVEVIGGKTYLWCACGKSQSQPWCDGSHVNTDQSPYSFIAKKTKTLYLCGCKQTGHGPFCDGTHQSINSGGREQYYQEGQWD